MNKVNVDAENLFPWQPGNRVPFLATNGQAHKLAAGAGTSI
jgi:hypothetical protein